MSQEPKFRIECDFQCSLHPDKIGEAKSEAILALYESGMQGRALARAASEIVGWEVGQKVEWRHRTKHFKPLFSEEELAETEGKRATDVEILDEIITAGYRNSKNWKPSIKDTLDAMKLKQAMTGGSAFEDFMGALNAALDLPADEEEEAPEAPEALGTPDEVPDPEDG